MEKARSGLNGPLTSGLHLALAAVLSAASAVAWTTAEAQVMELGRAGEVVTYDRPAVFNLDGSVPILSPRVPVTRFKDVATAPVIVAAAQVSQVGEDLIAAVAWSESRMRPRAVSSAGALGEMQLTPRTAKALGVDPRDSAQNYRGGAAYLHSLLIRYDGDLVKALAAYNAGPGAVDRYGGVPPFKETRAYVAAVLERLSRTAESR